MKKQKKQNILTVVIVILVLALIMIVGSAVYEEITNINKEKLKDTVASTENEDKEQDEIEEKEEDVPEEPTNEETESKVEEEQQPEEEYVGEEEQEVSNEEETTKSKDERAVELAKNEWGEDNTVTFSVEEKKGNKYYVAVKSDAIVITWYEVNTETWEISEYY